MLKDLLSLLSDYGWAAIIIAVAGFVLINYLQNRINIWYRRDQERTQSKVDILQEELINHQFFINVAYKLNNEIPLLKLDDKRPIRQKMYRKLLELKFSTLKSVMEDVVHSDLEDITPNQWANLIQNEMLRAETMLEEQALQDGMPPIVINKFLVWHNETRELLNHYVNEFAVSGIYGTNIVRTNTFLFLLNLKLITLIGDAERTLGKINGELTGKHYNGETLE